MLVEHSCDAVIDGGSGEPYTLFFARAEQQFSRALGIAERIGNGNLRNAALAGRASVKAAQNDWSGDVADDEQVAVDYLFDAVFSLNGCRDINGLTYNII